MSCKGLWFFGALLGLSLFAAPAGAQTNAALAETLFQEGKRLMSEQKYAEACPKFQESQRLDPGTGTLLNWGLCLKEFGKPASAWVVFNQAVASARAENRAERVTLAQGEIEKLNAVMPRIAVSVPTDSDAPGLVVTLDGETISAAARGVAAPVDPGDHVVKASAPQRKTWTTTVSVPAGARTHNVEVPKLELGSDSAAPAATESAGIAIAQPGEIAAVEEGKKIKRFMLGLRLNGSIPAGKADSDVKLSGFSKVQGTLWLEAGYRVRPELMLGAFVSVGSGGIGSEFEDTCELDGVDCTNADVRVGVEGTYHFGSNGVLPWVGAGIGFELMSFKAETPLGDATLDASGAEWLMLQTGLDFVLKQVQAGPFLSVSFARFTSGSCKGEYCQMAGNFEIQDPTFHEWIMLGLRGTVAL
jgi:hypothetical protein